MKREEEMQGEVIAYAKLCDASDEGAFPCRRSTPELAGRGDGQLLHELWVQGSRLRNELRAALVLHPENWHVPAVEQQLGWWDAIAERYAERFAAPSAAGQGDSPAESSCKHEKSYSYSETAEDGAITLSGSRKCVDCHEVFSPQRRAAYPPGSHNRYPTRRHKSEGDPVTTTSYGLEARLVASRFRVRQATVEVMQFTDDQSLSAIELWSGGVVHNTKDNGVQVETADGPVSVAERDFIVKGLTGNFRVVKEADFPKLYVPAEEGEDRLG